MFVKLLFYSYFFLSYNFPKDFYVYLSNYTVEYKYY